ncbi:hypothetical protein OROHE_015339 [Orobanche hederae]
MYFIRVRLVDFLVWGPRHCNNPIGFWGCYTRNTSVGHFSSKLDVPSNIVQKKRVAQILFFKIRLSQEILKIRDGTPLEAEEILTYIKKTLETDWLGTSLAS